MKTKFIFLFTLFSSFSFSQSLEKLKLETQKIYDANYTMDFDVIAPYLSKNCGIYWK
jgi:hypothetical protein